MIRQSDINRIIAEYERFCAYDAKCGRAFLKGVTLVAERRISYDARTGRWITAYPNGKEHEGRPLFIGENGRVLAGLGKANGKKLSELHKPETHQLLAWRGSSQRRNTKEDYEEREYWINEKRQSSKKALKREQKRTQKLERQSEQKLQEHPLSPEQQQAEATRQRFLNTPLPDHFESAEQAIDYFNKVAPNVDAADLKYMPAQCAHDVALAASKLGADFPHAFDKGFTFMLPDAEESRINAEKTKLEAEVNAGKFKAEAAAKYEQLLTEDGFLQSTLFEATESADLNDAQSRAKVLQQLWNIASKYGFDYKTVTISMLANSGAGTELKSIWIGAVSSYIADANREKLTKRQAEIIKLKKIGEHKVLAQWDQELKQCNLLSPYFVAKPSGGALTELRKLYQKRSDDYTREGFHPPLKNGISPLAAVIVHELVHCIDYSFKGAPISADSRINQKLQQARARFIEMFPTKQVRQKVQNEFKAFDKDPKNNAPPDAPYALYSYQEFVAEKITECLTAPEPTKEAQSTLQLFKQIYDMRVRAKETTQ